VPSIESRRVLSSAIWLELSRTGSKRRWFTIERIL
jgi:hypothetical protein